jgi:hypothetical protein
MPKRPVSLRIDSALVDRVDAARGDVSRTRFVERALEAYVGEGAVKGIPSPARPVAEEAAAPRSSRGGPGSSPVPSDSVRRAQALGEFPGVARASSLVKRGVVPIPKGKGK